MTDAELNAQYGYAGIDPWANVPPMLTSRRITLTAGLKTFVVIDAPDYPTAFRALFEQWTPGPAEHPALAGMPEIEAGPVS
jgi:hypothetical protein